MRHPLITTLELYSLSRLRGSRLARTEEHLLVCEECRERVSSLDRYHAILKEGLVGVEAEVHATEDGLIHNWVKTLPNGRCHARHEGPLLHGGDEFPTAAEAWKYLQRSFAAMFPEHRCGRRCKKRRHSDTPASDAKAAP